jgi:hypothetical protein
MAHAINIVAALGARARRRSSSPHGRSAKSHPPMTEAGGQPSVTKESVYRAIMLLDLAAQQTRLLLKILPSRRERACSRRKSPPLKNRSSVPAIWI